MFIFRQLSIIFLAPFLSRTLLLLHNVRWSWMGSNEQGKKWLHSNWKEKIESEWIKEWQIHRKTFCAEFRKNVDRSINHLRHKNNSRYTFFFIVFCTPRKMSKSKVSSLFYLFFRVFCSFYFSNGRFYAVWLLFECWCCYGTKVALNL